MTADDSSRPQLRWANARSALILRVLSGLGAFEYFVDNAQ